MSDTINESSRVSVVIPLYNGAETIERALDSVVAQTFQDIEILVVDDGSLDEGATIVHEYPDDRVVLLQQVNRGVGAARNRGIEAASTVWIAFLDSDDEWDEDFLETVIALTAKYPDCAVAATGYRTHFADGKKENLHVNGITSRDWEGTLDNYFELAAKSTPPIWTSALMARKDALDAIQGFPEGIPIGEDLITWANLATRYPIAYAAGAKSTYWHPFLVDGSLKRKPSPGDLIGDEFRALYKANPKTRGLRGYVGFWFRVRAYQCSRFGMERETLRACLLALKYRPFHLRVLAYYAISILPDWLRNPITRARA